MNIKELDEKQKEELKIKYYDDLLQEKENRTISYGEMAIINELVSDKEIEEEFGNIVFTNDDFFSSIGREYQVILYDNDLKYEEYEYFDTLNESIKYAEKMEKDDEKIVACVKQINTFNEEENEIVWTSKREVI